MKLRITLLVTALAMLGASTAVAIPALQLGGVNAPSETGGWYYDTVTETWVTQSNSATLLATANAGDLNGDGTNDGNGDYAWDTNPDADQYAYLVASAVPKTAATEPPSIFDITVTNATLVTSGNGTPPVQDTNDLSPHGIFATYFEIYEFKFDGSTKTISDTQPGGGGTGLGYEEKFDITINSLASDVYAVHFDLFTISEIASGSNQYDPTSGADKNLVQTFAPFSHDAQFGIPEPGSLVLLGLGIAGAGVARRRRKKA